MSLSNQLERSSSHPCSVQLAPGLLCLASDAESTGDFLDRVLPLLQEAASGNWAALVSGQKGTWRTIAKTGRKKALPTELLTEVLDAERTQTNGQWVAAPLAPRSGKSEVLVIQQAKATSESESMADALAALLHAGLTAIRQRGQQQRRIRRLEAILEIADQWNQTLEMDALLGKMAEASTRLLGAERASIFLWDKPNKTLVGRPALGVEGGELRIPDDKGIVGQVVQTGESRRVDVDIDNEQREIDRDVDQQLGFETQSLLCVPLRGKKDELFGAFEMINKIDGNFSDDDESALVEMAGHASIALENTQQHEQLISSRNQMAEQAAEGVQLIGECASIKGLSTTIARIADTDLTILILGENGTGKEVVSQQVHYQSARRNEPFVAVNCAALTESLLESELFGHEKGAFTDAHDTRVGKFELASGGTLFLDEIGDMSLAGQSKLLRVLEEKIVVRVGGSTPIHTDARVVAATNQNLGEMVRQKKFREDLFFRLNVVTLELSPLRERGDDVLLLAEYFLKDFCAKARRKTLKFTAAARKRLLQHAWPGNVRELRNLMERLAYLTQDDRVDADDLAFILAPDDHAAAGFSLNLPFAEATKQFQTQYIKKHLEVARGNLSTVSERLGMHRSNLYRKMRLLGIEVDESSDKPSPLAE